MTPYLNTSPEMPPPAGITAACRNHRRLPELPPPRPPECPENAAAGIAAATARFFAGFSTPKFKTRTKPNENQQRFGRKTYIDRYITRSNDVEENYLNFLARNLLKIMEQAPDLMEVIVGDSRITVMRESGQTFDQILRVIYSRIMVMRDPYKRPQAGDSLFPELLGVEPCL